jgi:quercetin dioxygenase-like cupin family protein
MKHIHYLDQEAEKTETDGANKAVIRHVITEKDGAPNFNLRVLTIEPGGQSPNHSHHWEHEFFVLKGKGTGEVNGEAVDLKPGDALFVPPNIQHCLRATETMDVI